METQEVTKKIPLVKGSTSYKIIVPVDVERTIRFLCQKVWDTEWSGVLFYTPSGDFADGSLEIKCVDILPMDIGNATYTEFSMSPDVISYMAQNPELLDCKMGLIHSHNNMSTFFSGTDLATLQEEGAERNHFVSLIVNNAGTYTAAITRHLKYKTRDLSYQGFNGVVTTTESIDGEEIEYFNLEVTVEDSQREKFSEISDRLSEIKKKKTPEPSYVNSLNTSTYKYDPNKTFEAYNKARQDPTLFDDYELETPKVKNTFYTVPNKVEKDEEIKISKDDVDKVVTQLITGSVTITKLEPTIREKLLKTMDKRFDDRFGKGDMGMMLFEYWAADFVEFLLWYSLDELNVDEATAASQLGDKVVDALEKLPDNKYIDKYIELIITYVNRL